MVVGEVVVVDAVFVVVDAVFVVVDLVVVVTLVVVSFVVVVVSFVDVDVVEDDLVLVVVDLVLVVVDCVFVVVKVLGEVETQLIDFQNGGPPNTLTVKFKPHDTVEREGQLNVVVSKVPVVEQPDAPQEGPENNKPDGPQT